MTKQILSAASFTMILVGLLAQNGPITITGALLLCACAFWRA